MTYIINLMKTASLKQYLAAMFIMVISSMLGTLILVAVVNYTTNIVSTHEAVNTSYVTKAVAPSQACETEYNAHNRAMLKSVYYDDVIVPYLDPVCEKQMKSYEANLLKSLFR